MKKRAWAAIWWYVVPTVVYILLTHNVLRSLLVIAFGLALGYLHRRPEIPEMLRPYIPLLQPIAVFAFLGGSFLAVAGVGLAIAIALMQRTRLIGFLQPWWGLQGRVPALWRRVLAFLVPFGTGYLFGLIAAGQELTMTFLSMVVGSLIAFLLTFSPPPELAVRPERRAA